MNSNSMPHYCYRLRPMNDLTIDELVNHFLWFSKRSGFKDKYDANIGAFIEDTPQIKRGLQLRYTEEGVNEIIRQMDNVGICCFTKKIPAKHIIGKFPKGNRSICIEYDKKTLEDYFENSDYALPNPFHDVVYDDQPTKMETDGLYHILWEKSEYGKVYKSINDVFSDIRTVDKLFQLLLTRINSKYGIQREMRIILGGRNLQNKDLSQSGYRVDIPKEAINKVYIINRPDSQFCSKLENIDYLKNKIVYKINHATPKT